MSYITPTSSQSTTTSTSSPSIFTAFNRTGDLEVTADDAALAAKFEPDARRAKFASDARHTKFASDALDARLAPDARDAGTMTWVEWQDGETIEFLASPSLIFKTKEGVVTYGREWTRSFSSDRIMGVNWYGSRAWMFTAQYCEGKTITGMLQDGSKR